MPDIYEQAQENRLRLITRERAAAGELLRLYRLTVSRIDARIKEITDNIEAARAQGEIISSPFLYERGRLSQLKFEIQLEINRFAQVASLRVAREQRAAVAQAAQDSQALIGEVSGDAVSVHLGTLNTGAVEAAASSPYLTQLFAKQGATVAQAIGDEIVSGVAAGAGVRVIASRVREVLGGELARALTISRTEVLRSYRTASLNTYRAHGFTEYRWLAAKDLRTCLVCLALDGSIWPVTQPMPAHVSCRCTFTVITSNEVPRESAAEWFAKQSEGAKRDALGSAYDAYSKGQITLESFVGFKQSARYGLTAYR